MDYDFSNYCNLCNNIIHSDNVNNGDYCNNYEINYDSEPYNIKMTKDYNHDNDLTATNEIIFQNYNDSLYQKSNIPP